MDIVFHRHLFVMANQLRLRAAWERLAGILESLLTITNSHRPHDVRHRYIVDALEAGDPGAARQAIEVHLARAQKIMIDVLRSTRRGAIRRVASARPPGASTGAGAVDAPPAAC